MDRIFKCTYASIIIGFLLLYLLFLLSACAEAPAKLELKKPVVVEADTLLLFFQKENRGEIWMTGKDKRLLDTFNWQGNYKLGALDMSKYEAEQAVFEQFPGKRAYVFPNESLSAEGLPPCFACRHDEIEAYATLNLVWKSLYSND